MRALAKASRIALMGFDVDGILTDGTLYFSSQGDEIKAFSSLDGHGLKMLAVAGVEVVIISGRRSRALELRAENLGIAELHMGISDKRGAMQALLVARGLDFDRAGYMGDDVVDLPILRACGFSATVADAHSAVRRYVDYVTHSGGGRGGAREVCDLILRAQDKLEAVSGSTLP
jgi:3-deoxy-D-manno-octulosonate 8-phosphate phosphatase (KDO 8-P phosphatase)